MFLTQDPAILQIRVMEGEGAVYPAGVRATRGITVQVTDETGKPVDGATVSFQLPENGPSGTFATAAKTEIVTTKGDGRASIWGMQWNHTLGPFEIRITAVKGQARAGTVCSEYLTNAAAAREAGVPRTGIGAKGGHKWLWITLAVAGAAGAGIAATGLGGKPSTTTPTPNGVQIGMPTISLGHP